MKTVIAYPLDALLSRYKLKSQPADVGIEVEIEGKMLPKPPGQHGTPVPVPMPNASYWSYVHDGSLRGEENAEYVLSRPIFFTQVGKAVEELDKLLKKNNAVLDDSNRTSVHIHLNCQRFTLPRLVSFSVLYFAFEDILTQWCGDHRVGNLFCLRGRDAPAILQYLRDFVKHQGRSDIPESLHYAAFNMNALKKFGSIEIRTMRGPTDVRIIETWVSILQRLYDMSAEYSDPRELIGLFSAQGPLSFFDTVLGPYADILRDDLGLTDSSIRESMYEGIRLVQPVCFCEDWDLYVVPTPEQMDPFGRVKIAKPEKAQIYATLYGGSPTSMPSDTYIATAINNLMASQGAAAPAPPLPPDAPFNPFNQPAEAIEVDMGEVEEDDDYSWSDEDDI